jgi:hypothetical protein
MRDLTGMRIGTYAASLRHSAEVRWAAILAGPARRLIANRAIWRFLSSSGRVACRAAWDQGRPVLFLAASCLAVAVAFLPVSAELSSVFVMAGIAALSAFYLLVVRGSRNPAED